MTILVIVTVPNKMLKKEEEKNVLKYVPTWELTWDLWFRSATRLPLDQSSGQALLEITVHIEETIRVSTTFVFVTMAEYIP